MSVQTSVCPNCMSSPIYTIKRRTTTKKDYFNDVIKVAEKFRRIVRIPAISKMSNNFFPEYRDAFLALQNAMKIFIAAFVISLLFAPESIDHHAVLLLHYASPSDLLTSILHYIAEPICNHTHNHVYLYRHTI